MNGSVHVSRVFSKEELCLMERVPEPCAIVIFGASGDLTGRKLIPSLFYLDANGLLPKRYYVLGIGRTPFSTQAFREKVRGLLPSSGEYAGAQTRENFVSRFNYLSGDYGSPETYQTLKKILDELDKTCGTGGQRIFYLSTPPAVYHVVVQQLGLAMLADSSGGNSGWARIVIEKPFGTDLSSAQALNSEIHKVFREDQVYRIDHYLGKETVQNILVFRFANTMFEPTWNHNYIDRVEITAAETLGVEHRAGYYEHAGVIRDMFQNHLLQLLALIAMEPPTCFEADAIRDKKVEVFESIEPFGEKEIMENVVRAQYAAGNVDGKPVAGYRQEEGVRPYSTTPTYAALKLTIDNWRWHGVSFYLSSGKRLPQRVTEIAVHFKHVPISIFKPLLAEQLGANVLRFRIQPDEGISISFEAKHPGPKLCLSTVTMDFDYQKTFGTTPPEAYARLLLDIMTGDQTLFARSDGVEDTWRILGPILKHWDNRGENGLLFYPAGTWVNLPDF